MPETLSDSALKLINDYFNLPFAGVSGVRCPYFNNAKNRQRGQIRALIGKGLPPEIVDEAKIISIQYKKGIFDKDGHCCLHAQHQEAHKECIQKFLADNNLGIDCSGFISHILIKHFAETKKIHLAKKMFTVPRRNFLRWAVSKLRPVEQMGVRVYADDRNTTTINNISVIKPADLIVMLKTGPKNNRNHMLLITENADDVIKYAHSRAWSSEGQYGHGVAKGQIKIINPNGGLLEQEWEEKNVTGETNETLTEAKQAQILQIRRLKF